MSANELAMMADPMAVEAYQSSPPPKSFPFRPVSALLSAPARTNWLLRPWLESGDLALVFGEPAVGKSFLVLSWATAIACGKPWFDCSVRQGSVFIIAGEGHSGFAQRMKALEIATGWNVESAPIFFSERSAALIDLESAKAVAESVDMLAKAHGAPALVIIDTLHRNLGGGDENSAADISRFLNHIDSLVRANFGCAVLIVHHSGHIGKDRARGSSALRAAVDHEFCLRLDGSYRVLECTKSKEHEPPEPIAFSLSPVLLPWLDDETGEPRRGAVLKSAGNAIFDLKKPKLTLPQRIARDALVAALRLQGERGKEHPGELPPGTPSRHVTEDAWFEQARAQGISRSEKSDSIRKAFNRAKGELLQQGLVEQWGVVFTIPDKSDKPGHVPNLSATMSGQTGHTPLGVSSLSDGPEEPDEVVL